MRLCAFDDLRVRHAQKSVLDSRFLLLLDTVSLRAVFASCLHAFLSPSARKLLCYTKGMIVVNFKTYKESTGNWAINLARTCKQVQDETGVRIVAVPQVADLRNCVETGADCWVQHLDPITPGRNTGWITVEDVEEAGAKGTLLNHSEHKLDVMTLEKTMQVIGDMAFEACICAASPAEAEMIASFGPDFVAYEPPELIASPDKSVATERPEIISEVVKKVNVPILIGAGVKNAEDVRVGMRLGAKGILLASGVVLAPDPEAVLRELAAAFKS